LALKDLSNRIEAELARRELADQEPTSGRRVVEERLAPAGTLRFEMVKGVKDRCKKCAAGEGHGPYRYLHFRRNGKPIGRYVGKTVPNGLKSRFRKEEEASPLSNR
jgi:hypothetical protein